jgi:hypothetical protein
MYISQEGGVEVLSVNRTCLTPRIYITQVRYVILLITHFLIKKTHTHLQPVLMHKLYVT